MAFSHLLIITNYYLMAMKKIKYRLVFNRKGHLSSDGKALIQIEAYLNRRRCLKSKCLYRYCARARVRQITFTPLALAATRCW